MKKSIRTLIIAVVVLLVLGGAYFAVTKWEPKTEPAGENGDTAISEVHYITDLEESAIASVEFHLGDFTYSIINGEDSATIEGYSGSIISSDSLKAVISSCSSIIANRKIDPNGVKLSEYGLENSDKYIVIKLNDNTEKKIILGNSAFVDGEYYVMEESQNQICTITSYTYEKLTRHPSELRDMTVCAIDNTSVSQIKLQKGSDIIFDIVVDDSEQTETEEQMMMIGYKMLAPYTMAASADKFGAFAQKLGTLTAEKIADENPSDLAQYGLDSPYTLTVTDASATHKLKLGIKTEDGVFMQYNDSPVVYLAECPFYQDIVSARPQDYIDSFIHIFNIDSVSAITVEQGDKKHVLSISGDTSKDGDATYMIDNKKVSDKVFKPVYQAIIGVTFSDVAQSYSKNNITCTIKFDFNDGSSKTFYYYNYDERNSAVVSDSGLECITLTKNITNITEQIEKALK